MYISKKVVLFAMLVITGIQHANAESKGRGFYMGAFAGAGTTDNQDLKQTATAYKRGELAHDVNNDPWDLLVDVKGNTKRNSLGLGGAQMGYEWAANSFNVKPAAELEAFYLGANQYAHLTNAEQEDGVWVSTANGHEAGELSEHHSIAAGVHQFANKMHMNMGLLMANGVFTYETNKVFKPYFGAGLGLAYINMTSARSYQTGPGGVELIDGPGTGAVIHFNSEKHDADVALAEQAKIGVRAEFDSHWSAFAEYRYLLVESSNYKFGSTDYPGHHVETSHWKVENDGMNLHAGLVGLQYAF